MISQLQSGRITGLAVNSKTRSPLFPDIPTPTEAYGSEQYPSTWFGLFGAGRHAEADDRQFRA